LTEECRNGGANQPERQDHTGDTSDKLEENEKESIRCVDLSEAKEGQGESRVEMRSRLLPPGRVNMQMAVNPMAIPVRTRRKSEFGRS
jgi:hypothetical protein